MRSSKFFLKIITLISVIESKFGPLPIEDVEVLLLAHEARLQRFQKHAFFDLLSINYM